MVHGSEQRKTSQMTSTSRANSGRSRRLALFVLFARFPNDGMTRRQLRMEAFGASGRVSTWLWWSRRSPQLRQKGRHGSSSLCQRENRVARFPRSIDALNQGTSQDQLVMGASNDLCPAFRLLWGAQTWHVPEQHLLVQAVAMLVRVAQPIGRADLGQGRGFIAFPDKPTDLGVTWAFARSMTDDADHAHLDPASAAQMQLVPAMDFHSPAALIRPLPRGVGFPMGLLIAALKTRSIFATRTALTRLARWSGAVQDAITFDAQQTTGCYLGHVRQKGSARVPAVADDHRTQAARYQQIDHRQQLACPDLRCQPRRSHALGIQHTGSLASFFGQKDDVTEHPAWTHGVLPLGQIGKGNQRAIGRRFGFPAVQVAGIHSQKDGRTRPGKRCKLDKDLAQFLSINLAVLKGFIQARPTSREKRRERQLGKAVGCRFTAQSIDRVEQRIACLLEAPRDRVTKFVQRVKVHRENAPPCFSFGGTLLLQAILCKRGLPEFTLV